MKVFWVWLGMVWFFMFVAWACGWNLQVERGPVLGISIVGAAILLICAYLAAGIKR